AEALTKGGEADAETTERVRARLKDLEFMERLEQIRMATATWVEGKFNYAGADRDYAQAFREYGVEVDKLGGETSIGRLKARPALAIPVASALDEWVAARRDVSTADVAGWKRLVAVARGIDPETLRDQVRATRGQPVSEVQDDLRRLAASIDIRAQQPATLHLLARIEGVHYSDASLRLLRDAQQLYPGDFWLNFALGEALHHHKDYEGAIRFYTVAVAIRPHSTAAHNNLGNALRDQKKADEAIACYRKAIDLDPTFAFAYSNLGTALSDQKKLDEAIAAYRKAIELDPKHARAHNNLGAALSNQNKLDEAVAAYRKAIELDPKEASTHRNLGTALNKQRKLDEAIAAYRKAIEIDPKDAFAYVGL